MSQIGVSILIAGIVNTKCSFTNFPECDFYLSYIFLIISILITIPYSYILTLTLRQTNFLYCKNRDKCVVFCIITMISNLILSIMYCSLTHIFMHFGSSYMDVLFLTIRFLQTLCFALYFSEISKILTIFQIKGSKIIYYITTTLIILLGILSILVYINYYISYNSNLFNFLYNLFQGRTVLPYLIIAIYIISFISLSITFIFSNLQEFLEPDRRKKLIITLFILPIMLFMYLIQLVIYDTKYWGSKFQGGINTEVLYDNFPRYKTTYFYMQWGYSAFFIGIMNLIPLAILYILSVKKDVNVDQKSAFNSENIISTEFSLS